MPIKVMYVLGTGSKHDNQELRWSLRSLEKFCQDDIEPVIVGSVPDWFTGEFVKCDDKTLRKNINILHKVCKGIESGIVKGEFLFRPTTISSSTRIRSRRARGGSRIPCSRRCRSPASRPDGTG